VFKEVFARHGIPEVVRSDNGRQFDCLQFREFAKMYSFKWTGSSPQYPQSNGQAESAVKLLKKILKKNDDPYLALLSYRNTSLSCGASPTQLLFGRALRDRLPISNKEVDDGRKRSSEKKL
jgi:transposase InsO family protein